MKFITYADGTQPLPTRDTTLQTEESILDQEEMEQPRHKNTCMMLTHTRTKADYLVTISVTRYVGGGDNVGDATMSIVKANGDVVASDSFSQHTPGSALNTGDDDISRQPITKLMRMFCKEKSK